MGLFPFDKVRGGQQELMRDVECVLDKGGHLVAHAPTGIGKTVAVVAPALSYALENGKTVFFLAPKHTQHTIVVDTLKKISAKYDTSFVSVDIIGKQWTCPHKVDGLDNKEFNEFCSAMKKDERCEGYNNVHKNKLSKKAKDVIDKMREKPLHAEEVKEICSAAGLCPYEVCIEAGKGADFIICDYFHIFSLKVRKAFLSKLNKNLEDAILIVDEAHNLPNRIRSTLSRNLSEHSVIRAAKEAAFLDHELLAGGFKSMGSVLKSLGKGMKSGEERFVKKTEFIEKLSGEADLSYPELVDMSHTLGEEVLTLPNRYRSYSKNLSMFLESWAGEDIGYARIFRKEKNPRLTFRCLDPSVSSKDVFEVSHATILMSGTLLPLGMYSQVLGLDKKRTLEKEYKSPFPRGNRLSIIVPGVTTKFNERSDQMYQKYANILAGILAEVPGNAAVFFPSYRILEHVGRDLMAIGLKKEIILEKQEMDKDDRIELYRHLVKLMDGRGGVLLGVQAGSLSEGVDYANNMLDAVIIVGLPLEAPNLETKALIEYYDFVFERGWDYGYIYPAMNRVLQAAGRCIRSETDKGAIVLMDERFKWKNYSKCFPFDMDFIVTEVPEKYIHRFFNKSI
jgi:DNA excision repair protein ERCC-2